MHTLWLLITACFILPLVNEIESSPGFCLQKNSGMCSYPTHIWAGEAMSLPRHLYPLEKFISGGMCNQSNWYLAAKCFNSVYLVGEYLVRNHI